MKSSNTLKVPQKQKKVYPCILQEQVFEMPRKAVERVMKDEGVTNASIKQSSKLDQLSYS